MNPFFKITPSFISGLIEQSSSLKSENEVLIAFTQLAELQSKTLKKEHARTISDEKQKRKILLEDIPEKLRPLADALYGLISVNPDKEDGESPSISEDYPSKNQ
jgi:hypothetical protein